jgi:excisionase family DNA binding protein
MNRPLSKSEASAGLGVCEKTLERLIGDNKIKAHRVGNRWKIYEQDLEAFLAECSNNGKPAAVDSLAAVGL